MFSFGRGNGNNKLRPEKFLSSYFRTGVQLPSAPPNVLIRTPRHRHYCHWPRHLHAGLLPAAIRKRAVTSSDVAVLFFCSWSIEKRYSITIRPKTIEYVLQSICKGARLEVAVDGVARQAADRTEVNFASRLLAVRVAGALHVSDDGVVRDLWHDQAPFRSDLSASLGWWRSPGP